jgi:hypothetical protein
VIAAVVAVVVAAAALPAETGALPTAAPAIVTSAPPADEAHYAVPLAHAAGVLVGMRLGVSLLWPEAYDPFPLERSAERYRLAFTTAPDFRRDRRLLESDGDPWSINVIGHGLFGAEIYGRVRQCGGSFAAALAFTAGTSALWEYGLEATSKQPSAIDLVLTPALGAALGEGRVRLQRWLRGRPHGALRRALEIVIDPLGEGERGILGSKC